MKLLFTLLVLLSITISYTRADTYGVGIWNNGTSVNVGLIDLTTGNQAALKLSIQGFNYQASNLQGSTYNYATKMLSFYVLQLSNKAPTLYVINCNTWAVVSRTTFNFQYQYAGLASTNTAANNLYTVMSNSAAVFPSKIDPKTNVLSKFDSIIGSYRGSVYVPTINSYYVAFTNQTGLYIRVYNSNNQLTTESAFGFGGNSYQVNNAPLNLVYSPINQGVLAQVWMTDPFNRDYYALAYLNWNAGVFDVTSMDGYTGDVFLTTIPDSNNQWLTYSFAYSFGQYTIYTFSAYTNSFVSFRPYETPILSAF
ncbi:hypothetical protein CYY_006575 [Polysphondylium violaceum]|uniref:Uncharacterized protein n=1 Tax=Polysphondylium violaceum TaxID=133409 RepID=A0A8J4PZH2_9MYCE|nr:hypothetical protein CYY_006575 [Polysphondylium violaceum]